MNESVCGGRRNKEKEGSLRRGRVSPTPLSPTPVYLRLSQSAIRAETIRLKIGGGEEGDRRGGPGRRIGGEQ